jgi:phosphoglycerate dehydrogenase-like enzyme
VSSVFIATGTIPALMAPRNSATQSAESSIAMAMRFSRSMPNARNAFAARSTRSASSP